MDSRSVSPFTRDKIIGERMLIYSPIDKVRYVSNGKINKIQLEYNGFRSYDKGKKGNAGENENGGYGH